jgi:4-amino-4-deoxy-L-arabinose transferase-like glycosyltransferase
MVIMFIGSFIVQYYLMSPIMVSNRIYITNNIGKAYIATIMGLFMVLLEVMMHDHQYHVFSTNFYIILAALLALFVYLYRKQVAINDTQYLEGMIEHHSMALLTSEEILKKTDNYDVAKLAKNIIQQQEDEIREMRELLKKPNI